MHMADALLSPQVGLALCAASAASIGYAAHRVRKDAEAEQKLPIMAVMGAFVFAAQMINFTIPGTGSSGHIGGGVLLSALLGGAHALLTISAVLLIQCLFFADGGLLALGCNIFNMGVIPCLIVYPLLFRWVTRRGNTGKRLSMAAVFSAITSLELGAFSVVLETLASGITKLPFAAFTALMLPIHLIIGCTEGLVTAGILCFVHRVRPELLWHMEEVENRSRVSLKKLTAMFAAATLLVAGGLSAFASSNPDGLEWSVQKITGSTELTAEGSVHAAAAEIQNSTAILPEYQSAEIETSMAGMLGAGITFVLVGIIGFAVTKAKQHKRRKNRKEHGVHDRYTE